jgi:uncharacterized membrane protein
VGFRKQTDADTVISLLRTIAAEARSGYNDGWTASSCKHELYRVKCYLDDVYKQLPTFVNEAEWEKERVAELLKRK